MYSSTPICKKRHKSGTESGDKLWKGPASGGGASSRRGPECGGASSRRGPESGRQSRKLAPDRRTMSDKFPGGPVIFVNSPDHPSSKFFCQPLPLRIDKSKFSVNST